MDSTAMQTTETPPLVCRKLPAARDLKAPEDASPVLYEDEYEKRNASLQLSWSALMEDGPYKTSSFYKKVKCLLISWDKECDDLHTATEVANLEHVLEYTLHYQVTKALLKNDPDHLAHLQVVKHVTDFLWKEDGHNTLLLVYYAGHGTPTRLRGGPNDLILSGKRSHDDAEEFNDIVWGPVEDNFQHTKADVLEIFDCCYAGDLGRTQQNWGTRSFEFLGACSSGNVTSGPGRESFTTALIWALENLVKEQTRFTVSELSCKIRGAPNFPADQVPVQFDRGVHAIERIMLAPISKSNVARDMATSGSEDPPSDTLQGLLHLNFIFEEPPSRKDIEKLAKALNRVMYKEKMPVNRIIWGGLCSWGGVQPSATAHSGMMKAANLFNHAYNRSKSKRKNHDVTRLASPRLLTPSSISDELSADSNLDYSPQPYKKIKRSTR